MDIALAPDAGAAPTTNKKQMCDKEA